jgi:hypothetical protein
MYILYDNKHSAEAEELSKVAKHLKLCDISNEISSKEQCFDILNKAGKFLLLFYLVSNVKI